MAEKEYIEREAVLKCVREDGHDNELDLGYPDHNEAFQEIIKEIPAADVVEVRPGRWMAHHFDSNYKRDFDVPYDDSDLMQWGCFCSLCGLDSLLNGIEEHAPSNYCPNCGAKMEV